MKLQLKIGLYVFTALGTLFFGILFAQAWRRANAPAAVAAPRSDAVSTNEPASSETTPEREAIPSGSTAGLHGRGFGQAILWGLLGVASLLAFGSLAAYDISHYAGQRATQALFNEEGEEMTESTYDQVEKAYGQGEFIEAIRLLREFLKERPRAIHAQIRIGEIYEKDLNNPVAAVLEYEELMKKSFDPERKGWTAIHLVNLYNRLDRPQDAVALMQRITTEFPNTPAAVKARERLEAAGIDLSEAPAPLKPNARTEPPSNLPPGFRPKDS